MPFLEYINLDLSNMTQVEMNNKWRRSQKRKVALTFYWDFCPWEEDEQISIVVHPVSIEPPPYIEGWYSPGKRLMTIIGHTDYQNRGKLISFCKTKNGPVGCKVYMGEEHYGDNFDPMVFSDFIRNRLKVNVV